MLSLINKSYIAIQHHSIRESQLKGGVFMIQKQAFEGFQKERQEGT